MSKEEIQVQLLVLGSGPGGYSAAFRAADLGLKVTLVEKYATLGGVCLNVGCIPSKALLHSAKVIDEAKHIATHGVTFNDPDVDIDKLRNYKDGVVSQLTKGLAGMAKLRKVNLIQGYGKFSDANSLIVENDTGGQVIRFEHCIIAAGSRIVDLPFLPDDSRVLNSTTALQLQDVPESMLCLGGGIIGLEMANVYHALGTRISVVELFDQIIPAADKDIVTPLLKRLKNQYENIMVETKVTSVDAKKDGLWVSFEGKNAPEEAQRYDKILSAVGRRPNGDLIDAEKAGIGVDNDGFIPVDNQMRTNVPHIFAIGDIVGQPMLAHKATHEAHIAAEVIAGKKHFFEPACIPGVAYTDPEVAWVGVTEKEARQKSIEYSKSIFPWAASGRALGVDRPEGLTKTLYDKKTNRVIGVGICGINAGELIAEAALAIEMGCDAEDLALTIHPHPTLSESIGFAAEVFEGTCTDLPPPRKRK